MARSIVSSGTDASRAFWYIVRNDALVSTSPPPSRAATSTWRISLAKTFARALSLAPLRCLVVAHFEWPDIAFLPPVWASSLYRRIRGRRRRAGGSARHLSVPDGTSSPRFDPVEPVPGARRHRGRDTP